MPLWPSHKAAQNGSFPMPIGLTTPTPVTTISCFGAMPWGCLGDARLAKRFILAWPNHLGKVFPKGGWEDKGTEEVDTNPKRKRGNTFSPRLRSLKLRLQCYQPVDHGKYTVWNANLSTKPPRAAGVQHLAE